MKKLKIISIIAFMAMFILCLAILANATIYWSNLNSLNSSQINVTTLRSTDLHMSYVNISGDVLFTGNPAVVNFSNQSSVLDANSSWRHVSYPSACSANYAVSELGDINTCSDDWVNEGGDTMTGNLNLGGNNITEVNDIFGNGTFVSIGNGTTSNGLVAESDLHVAGKLEVEGLSFFDASSKWGDDIFLRFGATSDAYWGWKTSDTPDTLFIGVGSDSNGLVICKREQYVNNTDHPLQTNPTVFIHSATDPGVDNSQFIGLTHNTTHAVIDSGNGSIALIDDVVIDGDLDVTGDLNVIGNSTGAFADLWGYHTDGANFTIAANGVYYNYSNLTVSEIKGFDEGEDNITAQIDGIFKVDYKISFDGKDKDTYGWILAKNYDLNNNRQCYSRRTAGKNSQANTGGTCFVRLSAGDTLSFMVENEQGTGDIDVFTISANIWKIGS